MTTATEPDVDVLVVGAGITGIYQLYRAREAGFSVRLLEAGDGVGRYVVLEPLPRCPVRFRELHVRLPVLEGALRGVGVAGALRGTTGDRALPQSRGRPVRPAARHAVRRQGHFCGVRRGFGHLARVDRRRHDERPHVDQGSLPRRRDRRAVGAVHPRRARPRAVPGRAAPHGTVAGRAGRRRRQTGRGHRHIVERGTGRRGPRRRGRVAHRLPALGQLVHATEQSTHHRRGAGPAARRLRTAARGAEHLDPRVPPSRERHAAPSTTRRRSGRPSSSRCGPAPVS